MALVLIPIPGNLSTSLAFQQVPCHALWMPIFISNTGVLADFGMFLKLLPSYPKHAKISFAICRMGRQASYSRNKQTQWDRGTWLFGPVKRLCHRKTISLGLYRDHET